MSDDLDFYKKRHEIPDIDALPPIVIKADELPPFPLTAIVGQTHLKKATLLAMANPHIHGVLFKGDRETGKGTVLNSGATYLPEDVPYLEMPLNVTRVQLFGGKAKDALGKEITVPGLVEQATKGYLFVERINLFDDGTIGKIISHAHKYDYTLLGTANLEDGEFPSALEDDIDIVVDVTSLEDIEERIEILKRLEGYRSDPKAFFHTYATREEELRGRVRKARELSGNVEMSAKTMDMIKEVCGKRENKIEALSNAAIANATLEGRTWAGVEDVEEVKALVLKAE